MRNEQYAEFNCYLVLNIPITATPGEIKSAFRKMSLKTHPDVGGSDAAQTKVNLAYETLSDPIRRQAHDTIWNSTTDRNPDKKSKEQTGRSPSSSDTADTTSKHRQAHTPEPPFSAFKRRIEDAIQTKKAEIWANIESLVEKKVSSLHAQIVSSKKVFIYEIAAAIAAGIIASHAPVFWIAAAGLTYLCLSKLNGIEIQKKKFSLFRMSTDEIRRHAESLVAEECHNRANNLNRHMAAFASMQELALRSSSFDDSETNVARRITVALFLMGYTPSAYNSDIRALLFTDGDEKLVVRYRHRTGASANVAYVERLHALMQVHRASHGLLFCSPGLSGNAARYAQQNGIKWYTLESMNKWVDNILRSGYSGPSGDILDKLEALKHFLSGISPRLSKRP